MPWQPGLPHKCKSAAVPFGFRCVHVGALLDSTTVGSMWYHPVVNRTCTWLEAIRLRIIDTMDQTHKLAHVVTVEPWRPESILRSHPSWRKDHEVHIGEPRLARVGRQNRTNGWIGMIMRDRVYRHKVLHVILTRYMISIPCNYVEWRLPNRPVPQISSELGHELKLTLYFV